MVGETEDTVPATCSAEAPFKRYQVPLVPDGFRRIRMIWPAGTFCKAEMLESETENAEPVPDVDVVLKDPADTYAPPLTE